MIRWYVHTGIHKLRVFINAFKFSTALMKRAFKHDNSKFDPEEAKLFSSLQPKLKASTYGTDSYATLLEQLQPALEHHYENNKHHPENNCRYFECDLCFKKYPALPNTCKECGNGTFTSHSSLDGMSLLDLIEMWCDWNAAVKNHANGSIVNSIRVNGKRFNIDKQLINIMSNSIGTI